MIDDIKALFPLLLVIPLAIRGSENKLVRRLRKGGAESPETAMVPGRLNRLMAWQYRRLLRRGVVIEVEEGRCFLSGEGYAAFRAARLKRALIIVPVVLLIGAVWVWIVKAFG